MVFPAQQLSATSSLIHGPPPAGSQKTASSGPSTTVAECQPIDRPGGNPAPQSTGEHRAPFQFTHRPQHPREKQQSRYLDTVSLDPHRLRPRHKHKHTKSRDGILPRRMNQFASSTGARGLLQTWSGGREKDTEADNALLRPMTRETTRSGWGSDSTAFGAGSRNSSLFDEIDNGRHIASVKRQDIQSMGDLEQVRDRRKQGEEYLRTALSLIGTLATDITRRLDYTYYNLLEKIAALNATVASFQELSNSTSTLFNDFERETTNLEHEVRKQFGELNEFQPQIQRIESLEERMRVGRVKAEALNAKLEEMRDEVHRWEEKEVEWQTRVTKRLRIIWGLVLSGVLAFMIACIIQIWPTAVSQGTNMSPLAEVLTNHSTSLLWQAQGQNIAKPILLGEDTRQESDYLSLHPSRLAPHQSSHQVSVSNKAASSTDSDQSAETIDSSFSRILDEL
ncbi:hypothetical protein P168DRAFT_244720 [Aspergillus campestris IBT 28561]|uniref:Uncharacterized protein n=1 Tax=Aspergillus campestris (strain IBT 28561) TaxID=1392248 RepID=A0A2I1CRD3_ASPC2|nr:uncharacterized protein P168DRAFT_244720 [Aspergillus campestris IBT 28561]PKY00182.1 hypothetical protein P168DRAFT_244720 [Aspergillus campestris IBT 28561]